MVLRMGGRDVQALGLAGRRGCQALDFLVLTLSDISIAKDMGGASTRPRIGPEGVLRRSGSEQQARAKVPPCSVECVLTVSYQKVPPCAPSQQETRAARSLNCETVL